MLVSLLLLQCLLEFRLAALTFSQYHLSVLPAFPEYERRCFPSYKQHLRLKASLLKFYFVGQTAGHMT